MSYSISRTVSLPFAEAINRVKKLLAAAGFGILTEIDVQATVKKKLDKDFIPYVILGACNPPFAYEALMTEIEIGLMMPCNVIVYEKNGAVHVASVRPALAMKATGNSKLAPLAAMVEEELKRVIDAV